MPFFLFSSRRRTWSPFSYKNFFVLLAQVSSAAILFAQNRYTEQFLFCFVLFFFHGKKILTKKKFFEDFFSCSWKTNYRNFQGEQKLRISAKMRKIGSMTCMLQIDFRNDETMLCFICTQTKSCLASNFKSAVNKDQIVN